MAEVNAQTSGKRMPTPVNTTVPAAVTTLDAQANAAANEGENAGAGDDEGEIEIDPNRTVEVRILRNHCGYVANTLELVTESEARSGDGDWCDAHEDAVAYIKGEAA